MTSQAYEFTTDIGAVLKDLKDLIENCEDNVIDFSEKKNSLDIILKQYNAILNSIQSIQKQYPVTIPVIAQQFDNRIEAIAKFLKPKLPADIKDVSDIKTGLVTENVSIETDPKELKTVSVLKKPASTYLAINTHLDTTKDKIPDQEVKDKKTVFATPKIISTIWVGTRPLPKNDQTPDTSNHHILLDWRNKNPNMQPILWVDYKSMPTSVHREYKERGYVFTASSEIDQIIEGTKSASPSSSSAEKPILVADISVLFRKPSKYLSEKEVEQMQELIRYEMDKFRPNYGAASDLIRYRTEQEYGGAYVDSDLAPGKSALHKHPAFSSEKECFNVTSSTAGFNAAGNDAFVCSPGHPLTKDLIHTCFDNYAKMDRVPETYTKFDHLYKVINRSGPGAVQQMLSSHGFLEEEGMFLLEHKEKYNLPEEFTCNDVTNQASWLKTPIKICSSLTESIETATNCMMTEMKYMGVCRFADYVTDIKSSLIENLISQLIKDPEIIDNFKKLTEYFVKTSQQQDVKKETTRISSFMADLGKFLTEYFDETTAYRITSQLRKKLPYTEQMQALPVNYKELQKIVFDDGLLLRVLAEENLLQNFTTASKEAPRSIREAYNKLVTMLQPLKNSNSKSSEILIERPTVSYADIANVLSLFDSRNDFNLNNSIANLLLKRLEIQPELRSLVSTVAHSTDDSSYTSWQSLIHPEQSTDLGFSMLE
ncbi:MAG TPA: glycosyltransferase [Gammaproteobacteria bacterium]|nr:glycosyltransferase [Gammaproteobacteria bacterium]